MFPVAFVVFFRYLHRKCFLLLLSLTVIRLYLVELSQITLKWYDLGQHHQITLLSRITKRNHTIELKAQKGATKSHRRSKIFRDATKAQDISAKGHSSKWQHNMIPVTLCKLILGYTNLYKINIELHDWFKNQKDEWYNLSLIK